MGLEPWEIEGIAAGLYGEASADPDDPPGAVALARRILGRDAVRPLWVDGVGAGLRRVGGRWIIYVGRYATCADLSFTVAHELAEWALVRAGYREDDRETVANAVGGALLLPPAAFRRAYAVDGFRLAVIAVQFAAPEGAVALRVGEVLGEPVALVTPSRIHRRDPHNDLPSDRDLRCLARQTLDPWYPVQSAQCTDAPGSTAFRRVG